MNKLLIFIIFLIISISSNAEAIPFQEVYKCQNIAKPECFTFFLEKCPEGYKIVIDSDKSTDDINIVPIEGLLSIDDFEGEKRIQIEQMQIHCENITK